MTAQDIRPSTVLLGPGTYGESAVPEILGALDELKTTRSTLVGYATMDFNRSVARQSGSRSGRDVPDFSPSLAELRLAEGNRGSKELAQQNAVHTHPAVERTIQRICEAYRSRAVFDGTALILNGFRSGHSLVVEHAIKLLHQRLPQLWIVTVTVLSDDPERKTKVSDGWELFTRLKQEGYSQGTIFLDNLSERVRSPRRNLDVVDPQVAHALAGFLSAQRFNRRSRALSEVIQSLASSSAFVGLAISVRDLYASRPVFYWDWLRQLAPRLSVKACGESEDIVFTACRTIEEAITDPSSWCSEQPDPQGLMFCLISLPLRRRDRRWPTVANEIRAWLMSHYEMASAIFICANGSQDPYAESPYRVQVSVLHGLPAVPAVLRGLVPEEPDPYQPVEAEVDGQADLADVVPLLAAPAAEDDF
jgi:hypothetical protein